eukprot:jgi/Hompol1/2112/HPOL_005853-RA
METFKRSGHFDSLRRTLLDDFQSSEPGRDLAARLRAVLESEGRKEYSVLEAAAGGMVDTVALQARVMAVLNRQVRSIKI